MTVLLKDALKPNLVQTLEGQPAMVHCGPFANIDHGNNSLVADLVAMKLGDYVLTESGFGSDMGMEKFFNIVCRFGALTPVGGGARDDGPRDQAPRRRPSAGRERGSLQAIDAGIANVRRHLGIIETFGVPAVVADQPAPGDRDREIELVKRLALDAGAFAAEVSDGFAHGGAGSVELADAVIAGVRAAGQLSSSLRRRGADRGQDRIGRRRGLRRRTTSSSTPKPSRTSTSSPRRPRRAPRVDRQDPPLALGRRVAPGRTGRVHASGARPPGVHRRRLARGALRRDHADARPR